MKRWAALGAAIALAVQVLVVGGATPANAYVGPGDDRQKATPTGWWWYTNVDASFVSSKLSANGARLTDISVYSASPLRFTVTMVANTGTYNSGWWWYYGVTAATAQQYATNNHARITVAKAYNTSAGYRYAVIMVNNTGTYAEAWRWYYGTVSYLQSKLSANSARLVGLSQRPDGTYLGVMARNTGNDATGWWWYVGVTTSQISSYTAQNHARIVDLNRNANGTWNVVMYANPAGTYWWWYVNQSIGGLHDRALQLGARIIDVQAYTIGSAVYYAGVFVDNVSALTAKIRSYYFGRVTTGHYGFEMKLVGGPTYVGLQEWRGFEPASTLKVLYHAKSIHEESLGNAADTDGVDYHYNPADPTNKDICPDSYASTSTTNLKNADTKMMQVSDNRMTRAILEKYTSGSMTTYAASLGMTGTAINHNIGCGSPHNVTTLTDMQKVYEGAQNGTVTSNATWFAEFKSRMLNDANYSWRTGTFCPIAQQEGASLGKPGATIQSFCNAATWYAKGGSYQYAGAYPYGVSWTGCSMTGIPFKNASHVVTPKYYFVGEWVDGTVIHNATEASNVSYARSAVYREALRSSIRAALATW